MWVPASESRAEIIDGEVGLRAADPNIPGRSADEWAAYRARVEAGAASA